MPEIESVYSTYAKSADDEGFAESRDHRAFAGLSRGAVTMYHSALCQSLDYFSWFGAFSGSRTDRTAFEDTIQTGDFAELPIHYYMWQAATSTSPCLDRFRITRLCWI